MKNTRKNASDNKPSVAGAFLGSPRTAQGVMVAAAVLVSLVVLPLSLFGSGSGESARRFATSSAAATGLYMLLAGSLVVCMVFRLRGIRRRISAVPRPRTRIEPNTVVAPVEFDASVAQQVLRRAGYRHIVSEDNWVWGVKHRWSPVGTLVLHLSLLLGLVAAAASALPGLESMTHVSASSGDAIEISKDGQEARLARFDAEEGRDGILQSLSAELSLDDDRTVRLRPDLPALVGPTTAVTIEDFDMEVAFSITPTDSPYPTYRRVAKLRLRSAASHDVMTMDAGSLGLYRIMVRRAADGSDRVVARVERLEQGGVWRVAGPEATYRRGEIVEMNDMHLRFEGLRPYALLRVHESPSAPLLSLALLGTFIGSFLRLVIPRRDATIASMSGGSGATVVVDVFKGSRTESSALALAVEEES